MLKKKVSNKVFCMFLVIAITLFANICMASLNWSYLVDCSSSLNKVKLAFGQKALGVYGSTMVDGECRAGVRVTLKFLNEEGQWETLCGWNDFDQYYASVGLDQAVGSGTYKLHIVHTAYAEDDVNYETPLETYKFDTQTETY